MRKTRSMLHKAVQGAWGWARPLRRAANACYTCRFLTPTSETRPQSRPLREGPRAHPLQPGQRQSTWGHPLTVLPGEGLHSQHLCLTSLLGGVFNLISKRHLSPNLCPDPSPPASSLPPGLDPGLRFADFQFRRHVVWPDT